ncbi:unnamed protein product [Ilex paraguariensis]|uniref:Uncharacterized protein n=1 Tax=Ilex paraguariensis TaxID=185542 RepID=A0ABC8TZL0_9AQUA
MVEHEEIYHQYDDGNGNQKHDWISSKNLHELRPNFGRAYLAGMSRDSLEMLLERSLHDLEVGIGVNGIEFDYHYMVCSECHKHEEIYHQYDDGNGNQKHDWISSKNLHELRPNFGRAYLAGMSRDSLEMLLERSLHDLEVGIGVNGIEFDYHYMVCSECHSMSKDAESLEQS